MSNMADVEHDALEALQRLRAVGAASPNMWHPALVGAATRLLMDWLTDTAQIDARDELHGIDVVSPMTGADMVRLGDIGEAERRAASAQRPWHSIRTPAYYEVQPPADPDPLACHGAEQHADSGIGCAGGWR